MAFYLCKIIQDNDGNTTGHTVVAEVETQRIPKKGYEILKGQKNLEFRKTEFSENRWRVVEDDVAKAAAQAKRAQKQQDKQDMRDLIQSIDNDLDAVGNLNQLKTFLKQNLKKLIREIYD